MSIALFSLADAAVAQGAAQPARTKTPPKRQVVARPDVAAVPEPR